MWFRYRDVTVVAIMTSADSTYSLKSAWERAKKNRFRGGFNPLFELFIPLQSASPFYIQSLGRGGLDAWIERFSSGVTTGVWQGERFQISAEEPALKARIEMHMDRIATLLRQIIPPSE